MSFVYLVADGPTDRLITAHGLGLYTCGRWCIQIMCRGVCVSSYLELPDPFAKIVVDESGQCHCTEVLRSTVDPKWNQHYDL